MDIKSNLTELVITAPYDEQAQLAYEVGARTTLGVLTTLIAQASRKLTIISPFVQPNESLDREPLQSALESAISKDIHIEIASTQKGLDALFQSTIVKENINKIRFFQAAANYENENVLGSHAKIYLADDNKAYVGSANLTRPGLSEHLEMGVLVTGNIAEQVASTWKYLITKRYFVEVFKNR